MASAPKAYVKTALLQQGLAIVDREGRPTAAFVRLINDNNANVAAAINAIAAIPAIQQALAGLDAATQAAQAAADAANQAADVAAQTAADAQAAADSANMAIEQIADGTLALEAVTIGGQRFVNQAGELVAE